MINDVPKIDYEHIEWYEHLRRFAMGQDRQCQEGYTYLLCKGMTSWFFQGILQAKTTHRSATNTENNAQQALSLSIAQIVAEMLLQRTRRPL